MKRFDLAILVTAVALVTGIGGFVVGHFTAPKVQTVASNNSSNSNGGGGQFYRSSVNGRRPVFGSVSAVIGNTITVSDRRTGQTITVNVNTQTAYSDGSGGNATESLASITSGTSIAATGQADSNGNITASRIIVNPQFGGFGGGGGSTSGGSSSGSGQAQLN